jgi:hypothetical protein
MGLYTPKRSQRDATQRHDQDWIDHRDLRRQPAAAHPDLRCGRRSVVAATISRIAQDGVGQKHVAATPAGGVEQGVQPAARLIAAKGDAGAFCAETAGSLAHEQHPCVRSAVRAREHAPSPVHRGTRAAPLCLLDQFVERSLSLDRLTGEW